MKRYKVTEEFHDWLAYRGSPFAVGMTSPWGVVAGEDVKYMLYLTCDCPVCGGTGIAEYRGHQTREYCGCDTPFGYYLELPDDKTFEDLFKELGVIEDV